MNIYMLNFWKSIFSFVTYESDKYDRHMQCPSFKTILDPPKRRESFFPISPAYWFKYGTQISKEKEGGLLKGLIIRAKPLVVDFLIISVILIKH